jgi:hypothetical protein
METASQMSYPFFDANENAMNGPLNTALSAPGLMMREGVYLVHPCSMRRARDRRARVN